MNPERPADVRLGADNGLKSDMIPSPKSGQYDAVGLLATIYQVGRYPLIAMAVAEYPTPSHKGCRQSRTASINLSLSLNDIAAIMLVVGA